MEKPPEFDADELISEQSPPSSSGLLAPVIVGFVAILLIVAAFLAGFLIADDEGEVTSQQDRLTTVEEELHNAGQHLGRTRELLGQRQEKLELVRKRYEEYRQIGQYIPRIGGRQEFVFDRFFDESGRVGHLTVTPVSFERRGNAWVLTFEGKNESELELSPFCLGGARLAYSSGVIVRGEGVISEGNDSCERLDPGDTGTYEVEFAPRGGAEPEIVAIGGAEGEADRVWDLPPPG